SAIKLSVVTYNDEGVHKQWDFLIDGPTEAGKPILNIMGSSTQCRFEMRSTIDRDSGNLPKQTYQWDADASETSFIKEIAKNAEIHNEYPEYNCQDNILDLLDSLEEKGVIDGIDVIYKKSKEIVKGKKK
ncbi:hypothetical protein BGW36DRAFT_271330, partial [Talaromyces proteolyticus]